MKTDQLKVYALETILLTILSFTLFVPNSYTRIALAVLIAICAVATWVFIKKRKTESIDSKKVTIILSLLAIVYLTVFYVMGLFFGYSNAVFTFSPWVLTHQIIPFAVIIISSEIIRSVLITQNTKLSKLMTFIIMVMIDMVVYIDVYNMAGAQKIIDVVAFVCLASIANNLLYNYTSNKYGFVGIIVYRLITVLYTYIIPIVPNVEIFFRSIMRMVYPYIIFQILEYTFEKKKMIIPDEDKRRNLITKIILIIIAVLLAMLISCQFKYGALVIATESMTGSIDKGDAVIYEQFDGQNIEKGQVIIFDKDGTKTVHRVMGIKNVNGELRYITKGDANQQEDDGYITNDEICGIVNFKIQKIGYPSIWLRDILNKK